MERKKLVYNAIQDIWKIASSDSANKKAEDMTDEEYERVRAKAAHAGCEFSSYARTVLGGKAVPSEVKLRRELAAALPAHANLINKLPDNLPVKKQFIEWEEKAWQLLR